MGDIILVLDRPEPKFAFKRRLQQTALAIGSRPVVPVEPVKRNAAPLQNREGYSANLPGVHNNGRTELDLTNFTQLDGIRKSRYQ